MDAQLSLFPKLPGESLPSDFDEELPESFYEDDKREEFEPVEDAPEEYARDVCIPLSGEI